MADNPQHLTLSQFQALIKETLAGEFSAPVWIVAEIGELKVNSSSGHCYLELVEKGGANSVPKARANAVIWRHTYGMLSSYFKGATGEDLAPGMKVLMGVTVNYHELYGLSLQVSDIDPLYTLGDLERQRQETIAQLREDGVFDLNRELGIPPVPQRIAVISSPNAAGFQDFMNELRSYGYYFKVELFEAVMQGHGAEESIIDALGRIAVEEEDHDVVVIIRGGGAQSDLNFLNSYLLSFHVAQFPLPVIAGLGHDKDQSVIDMVAAVSLKTPTAVAGFLAQQAAGFDAALDSLADDIMTVAGERLAGEDRKLQRSATALLQRSMAFTRAFELRLSRLENDIANKVAHYMIRRGEMLAALETTLGERARSAVSDAHKRLDNAGTIVAGRDPEGILALGFAIVRQDGKVLRDASGSDLSKPLDITLHKGKIEANIKRYEK